VLLQALHDQLWCPLVASPVAAIDSTPRSIPLECLLTNSLWDRLVFRKDAMVEFVVS
jgi:hypothetical protein